jgi:tetratricopeptide (TPR) repeat protein
MELVYGSDTQYARDALYLAATYSYSAGRYGECATLLKRYAQKYPNDGRAGDIRRMLALSDLMAGKYAAAISFCTDDSDETLVYAKAIASDRLGNRADAVAAAGKYLDTFPQGANRPAMELLLARAEFDESVRTNGVRLAIAAGKRIVSLSGGKNASDRLRLGWAYEKAGEVERADAEYAGVARDFPKSASAADALYRRAMAQLRQEKWAGAELSLAEAISSGHLAGERAALGWYWRGIAAMRSGHAAESLEFLGKALEAGLPLDESREARLLVADADFNAGRRDKAVKVYSELVRQGAVERMSAAKTLAVGRLLSGEEARACAMSLARNGSAEWRQAGWALMGDVCEAEGNFVAAGDAYAKCLAEKCSTEAAAAASVKLGGYLLRDGRPREAEEAYKRAVELNASDDEARAAAYLGLAKAARARDDDEAVRGYATVVTTLFEKTASAAEAKEMLK